MDTKDAQKIIESYYNFLDSEPTESELAELMKWFLDWEDIEFNWESDRSKPIDKMQTLTIKMSGIGTNMARKMSIIHKLLNKNEH